MDREEFKIFLKRGGRSQKATDRWVNNLTMLKDYSKTSKGNSSLDQINSIDLMDYVNWADSKSKTKTKSYLWAIRYYYEFKENSELSILAGILREERIVRKPFLLKNFLGIEEAHIEILREIGIRNVEHMCAAGATAGDRHLLADRTGSPLTDI